MLKNLFKIALRNIAKDKVYSAINIFGLTIGITCSLFLLMYILDELSYDRYHKNAESIYRVVSDIKEPDNAFTWATTQLSLAPELRDNYPEVINAARFIEISRTRFKNGDKEFYEDNFFLADSTVFDMFSYKFINGDPATALDNTFSTVITESIAVKYFGSASAALGQALINDSNESFKVTGVIKDVPFNSHFRFDALVSESTRRNQGGWGGFGVYTYIQLPEKYALSKMNASFDKIIKEKVDPIFEQYGIRIKYVLQPITGIHLYSKIQDEAEGGGDISYIYIFGAVAGFMLVIACINYMNLATARSVNRSKEVGIRKVMGSMRRQLILQFITESLVIALIAMAVSMILIYALLPAFNVLSNKHLEFSDILRAPVMLSLLGIVVFVGVAGGSYPALYLSGFNPVSVLKGKVAARGGSVVLRKGLVIVQFAISIFMLISTFVVFDQLTFLRNKDLGFDKTRVLRLDLAERAMQQKKDVLMERLKNVRGVEDAGSSDATPGQRIGKSVVQVEVTDGEFDERGVDLFSANFEFVTTMGLKIVEGRNFSRDVASDTTYGALINEAMVKRMNWKNPIGKKFIFDGGGQNPPIEKHVVGVVKDFHQNSLYDVIEPVLILLGNQHNYVFVRTEEGDVRTSLSSVERVWKEVYPGRTFEYEFLDQDFNSQYRADEKRSQIFTVFSSLTVAIACLGLLGLSAFTTEQRTKEIGVRKVIGASVQGLVLLVSKEFFVLVMIGLLLALPAAWYFTERWLQNFAYRIPLTKEWPTFLASGILALFITALTVGYHVVRAAAANPVKALREN